VNQVVHEEDFDQWLGPLLISDGALAIPEDASVLVVVNQRVRARSKPRLRAWALVAVLLLLILAAILAATPVSGAVPALRLPFGMVQRFGLVLVGKAPTPAPAQAPARIKTVPKTAVSGARLPDLTLAEAQQQVAFTIPKPSYLPPGVVFRAAHVAPDHETVVLSYTSEADSGKGMGIQLHPGTVAGGYAIPSTAAQNVKVDDRPAVYAHGAWTQNRDWDPLADAGLLSWQDSRFTYVLMFSGLGLSRDEVVQIAASVR
jgi:hypothetical protein